MTIQRAKELMEIELTCIQRNEIGCDRNCAVCDLVQDTQELIAAYECIISYITSVNK